jgi:hypothetical protein
VSLELMNDVTQLKNKIAETSSSLNSKKQELQAATDKATREVIIQSLTAVVAGGAAVVSTAGCVSGGVPACIGAFGSCLALVALVEDARPIFDSERAEAGGSAHQLIDFVEVGLVAAKGRAAK